eukprot:jgi/Chrzof1/4982/Cz15g07110.t1
MQALTQDNQHAAGRLLMESWVNQVLSGPESYLNNQSEAPLQQTSAAMKGLASYGLARDELLHAGLSNAIVDRLYQSLYVYSVGFFDVLQASAALPCVAL